MTAPLFPLVVALLLAAGCSQRIELFPVAADAATVPRDGAPAPDLIALPDLAPACVCRFNLCRTAADCHALIDVASSCGGMLCSGATGRCATAADCAANPAGWLCTIAANSVTPCP